MGWKDAPVVDSAPAWASAPEVEGGKGFLRTIGDPFANLGAGFARGVRDVLDTGAEALATGYDKLRGPIVNSEAQRVKGINAQELARYKQETEGSAMAPIGRVGGQVAITYPIGGVFAKGAQMVGAPNALVNALRTSGMTTGGAPATLAAKAGDLAIRSGAGAAVGGASAAAVNPDDFGTGVTIGGASPAVLRAAGWLGSAAGSAIWKAMTPELQKRAVQLAEMTGQKLEDVISGLTQQGPSQIPGSQKTVPQILQNRDVSQVARTLKSSGQNGLGEREALNSVAQMNALERVAPTAGTVNEARANLGNATVSAARAGEKAASQRVRSLFDAVESQDDVRMFLPIDQMEAARGKFLGRGSFGAGGGPADQAINTAKEIGTTTLDAVKAAPMQKQQSLYEAVLSAGGIHKNSPSGRQLLGELKDLAASKQKAAVRANSGKSADLLAQEMHARGFIPDEDPATLIQYLKDAGRDTFATDANMAGQYARRAEAAMGDLPGAEVLPKAVPFQEMQNLRSSIGEAAQTAKVAGNKQAAAALSEMKRSIDAKINAVVNGGALPGETFSQESANLYRKALAEHAAKKAQFNTGPQAAIFRTGSDGLPAKEGAEVAPLFWNSGNAQIENMQAFKRLTKEDKSLVALMKSNATTEARQMGAKGPMDSLTFDAFNKWMKNHAGAAKELFTEQELSTLRAIQKDLKTAASANSLGQAQGSNTAQNIFSMGALGNSRAQAVANNIPLGVGKYVTGPLFGMAKENAMTNRNAILSQLLEDPAVMADALKMYSQRQPPSNALVELLRSPQGQQLLLKGAPVASTSGQ